MSPKPRRASASSSQLGDLHRQLAALGAHDLAGAPDPVAEVELAELVERCRSTVAPREQLDRAGRRAASANGELALAAQSMMPARRPSTATPDSLPGGEVAQPLDDRPPPWCVALEPVGDLGVVSLTASHVALEDDAQPVQGQPRLVVLDRVRVRGDERAEAAGGHDGGRPELLLEAPAQPVDLAGEPVDDARLDRLDRRPADHAAGLDQLDPAQGGGLAEERLEGDLDARARWRRRGTRPWPLIASKVVAVPKSTTMHGPP